MPRKVYPPEFRRRVVELWRSGRPVAEGARLLEVSDASLHLWRRQDRGEVAGVSSTDDAELAMARRRTAERETELAIHRRAAALLKAVVLPKGA